MGFQSKKSAVMQTCPFSYPDLHGRGGDRLRCISELSPLPFLHIVLRNTEFNQHKDGQIKPRRIADVEN